MLCRLHPATTVFPSHFYLLAGVKLASDETLSYLAPFRLDAVQPEPVGLGVAFRTWCGGAFVYRGPGWVGNAWREVSVWRSDEGYRLLIENVGVFAVLADGSALALDCKMAAVDGNLLEEALLGAPLILALALKGVWCLHAAAVSLGDRVIAFAGESGRGKSTLAGYLSESQGGLVRVADDILPVSAGAPGPVTLPHFPQLKIAPAQQYPVAAPARLPFDLLFALAPRAPGDDPTVRITPLQGSALTTTLIRHTVASRLFAPELMREHLAFCAKLAGQIRGYRLSYPKRLSVLPRLQELIVELAQTPA